MRVCVWEKTMFLLARYTVAAAVFLSASAAIAVEDVTPSADYLPAVSMLPACKAFIADVSPLDIYVLFEAGRCIGLITLFCDSWVVGFWRGRPWLAGHRIGKKSLDTFSSRFWIGWDTRRGDRCARSTCRG